MRRDSSTPPGRPRARENAAQPASLGSWRIPVVAVVSSLALAASPNAWAGPKRPNAKAKYADVPAAPPAAILVDRDPRSLGSMSVGHAHAGFLFNAVRMPTGKQWALSVPDHAWGTEETIANLIHCIGRVHQQFPGSPPVIIGSISARHGGPLPPHKSHRTGRDVDLYLYRLPGTKPWHKPAGPDDLDRPRVWALMRALITETDVEFVLLDRAVQKLLEEYALSIGEDPEWMDDVFRGGGNSWRSIIKHVPGHTAHMHVRFISARARERARWAYDRLLEQGHLDVPGRQIRHEVEAGETLTMIAHRFGTTVEDIKRINKLKTAMIRIGQPLLIKERQDIRGAREVVIVPPRRMPPKRKAWPRLDNIVADRATRIDDPGTRPERTPLGAKTDAEQGAATIGADAEQGRPVEAAASVPDTM